MGKVKSSFLPESGKITMEENLETIKAAIDVLHLLAGIGDEAALETIATITPELAIANQSILFRFYELTKILENSNCNPNQTVLSGSGVRIDEIMAYQASGRVSILSSEPNPTYSCKIASHDLSLLNIRHQSTRNIRQLRLPFNGVVVSDDTHEDLLKTFSKIKVDELGIIRLDPDSLVTNLSIDSLQGGDNIAIAQITAIRNLLEILTIVKDGGEAVITVGLGNTKMEYLFRKAIIFSLHDLCIRTGIEVDLLGSPWLDIYSKYRGNFDLSDPLMKGILRGASLEGVRIRGSKALQNLHMTTGLKFFRTTLYKCLEKGLSEAIADDLPQRLNLVD